MVLRQSVVESEPCHFSRDPDVLGRREGVAVVERRERHACRRSVGTPGKQPRAAALAENPVERFR